MVFVDLAVDAGVVGLSIYGSCKVDVEAVIISGDKLFGDSDVNKQSLYNSFEAGDDVTDGFDETWC